MCEESVIACCRRSTTTSVNPDLPKDTIVVHLHAEPGVIRSRMESDPHPHQLVPSEDVEGVLEEFAHEFQTCSLKGKFAIDTSSMTPEKLFEEYMRLSILI